MCLELTNDFPASHSLIPLYTQIKLVSNAWLRVEATVVTTRYFSLNWNNSINLSLKPQSGALEM